MRSINSARTRPNDGLRRQPRLAASGFVLSHLGLDLGRLHHPGTERDQRHLMEMAMGVGMMRFDTARLFRTRKGSDPRPAPCTP